MSGVHKQKLRSARLRELKARSHVRLVPEPVTENRHLQGDVDEKALAFADMSQVYSERIRNFDASVSKAQMDDLLKTLDDQVDPLDTILEPVFLSLFDSTIRVLKLNPIKFRLTRPHRIIFNSIRAFENGEKHGITVSRLYHECKSFDYASSANTSFMLDSRTEHLIERDHITQYDSQSSYNGGDIIRGGDSTLNMRDGTKMKAAKARHFDGNPTASDGYGGKEPIYQNKTHAKKVDKHQQKTEMDHAVPCAEVCNSLKKNKGLSDTDIKEIVNIDDNLVATSFTNNRGKDIGKFDKSKEQLQKEIDQGYVENSAGKKKDLSKEELEVRKNMVAKMETSQKSIDAKTNQTVMNNVNIFESEERFRKRVEKEYRAQRKKGVKSDSEHLKKHVDEKVKGRKDVRKRMTTDAYDSAVNQSFGDMVLFMIKPLYYELKDCLLNGIETGVDAHSFKAALSIRINRIKRFAIQQAGNTLKDGAFSFFKNFVSMLLEGVVNCFVGVFKSIVRMVKEGFKVLMQIIPILRDKTKTMAEKGDAILKLVAGSLTIFASIGIETWLNSMGIAESWSIVISSVLTVVLAALTMYLIDKMDLFGLKEEARYNRIDEILSLQVEEAKDEMFSFIHALS